MESKVIVTSKRIVNESVRCFSKKKLTFFKFKLLSGKDEPYKKLLSLLYLITDRKSMVISVIIP